MLHQERLDWVVLLIGGPSGVGKSTAAKQIARRFGVPWLQVDDLRLALQWSRVRLPDPDDTGKLYFSTRPTFGGCRRNACAMALSGWARCCQQPSPR